MNDKQRFDELLHQAGHSAADVREFLDLLARLDPAGNGSGFLLLDTGRTLDQQRKLHEAARPTLPKF